MNQKRKKLGTIFDQGRFEFANYQNFIGDIFLRKIQMETLLAIIEMSNC